MSSRAEGAAPSSSSSANSPHIDDIATRAKEVSTTLVKKIREGRQSGGGAATSSTASSKHRKQECQLFFEDEVFRIDRKGRVRFGVVTETSETYSSDDDEDIEEPLMRGDVRVAFYPDGKEVIRSEQSIGLADRSLMPGDVVRRRLPGQKGLSGQAGYVRDVSMRADVKVLGTKYVIRNVPAERLRQISEWASDVPVCYESWVGTTVKVDESALLKSSNGALIEISSNDFHKFKDANGPHYSQDVFNPNVYYPGNVIIGRLPTSDRINNLTPDIPLPPNRKSRAFYTVESIYTTGISVAWTCKAVSQCQLDTDVDPLKQPSTSLKGSDLDNVKRLNLYESCMLQIHDRFYLKYSTCDKLLKYDDWELEQSIFYHSLIHRQQNEKNAVQEIERDGANVEPSPSSPSNLKTRKILKMRRLLSKSNGGSRSFRGQSQTEVSSKNGSGKSTKSPGKSEMNDEIWDSLTDDEEDFDTSVAASESNDVVEELNEASSTASKLTPCTAQMPRFCTRNSKRRHIKKKVRSIRKTLTSPFLKKEIDPKDGDELVVETLVVNSSVTVVWQDGNVESGIPSTQLYPIHHLDNHEFFPGDFVSKSNECSISQTSYGVVQSVNHDERIALVKWYYIYSAHDDNSVPVCKETEELSVYDLKDHADYQYRPGTMVIRVANFTGENLNSTAGQVIDNFPDGRVRVWWAKGHITMCYPQDLFEINHNDADQDGYEWEGSDESWETDSEASCNELDLFSSSNKQFILSGIDGAKDALFRLERILYLLPAESKVDVLNDLLILYKNCCFLDRLLSTNFFDEDHFQGIVKIKTNDGDNKSGNDMTATETEESESTTTANQLQTTVLMNTSTMKLQEAASPIQFNSTPTKRKSSTDANEVQCKKSSTEPDLQDLKSPAAINKDDALSNNKLIIKYRNEYTNLLKTARNAIIKAMESRQQSSKNDSGNFSNGENSSNEIPAPNGCKEETSLGGDQENFKSMSSTSIELIANRDSDVCEIFCFLMKEQMIKCREMIVDTLGKYKKTSKPSQTNAHDDDVVFDESVEEKDGEKVTLESEEDNQEDATNNIMMNLNALSDSLPSLERPMASSSPPPLQPASAASSSFSLVPTINDGDCFQVQPIAPQSHSFFLSIVHPASRALYHRAVQREFRLLNSSLPAGVFVRAYEDRMDLISVMMIGPKRTPYQNALFFFDFQMGRDFPKSPPTCHYISFCTDRLNPNLYEEGKVCVSLLGTWAGRDSEVWTPDSTMLQVLVSIQGLILVDEPYYNEAGYEKQRGTQLGNENSRVYNEMAIIKIAHSTVKQLQNPPLIFQNEVIAHFKKFGNELHQRMQSWLDFSTEAHRLKIGTVADMPEEYKKNCDLPDFPLLPGSRGFCIAARGVLDTLKMELNKLHLPESPTTLQPPTTAPKAATEEL